MARVAAFCVEPILKYVPRSDFTKLIRLILSGERRRKMKVTAYKQILRLLMNRVTKRHLAMVSYEWNRVEVHRDVRIVIIKLHWVIKTESLLHCYR
eukprot:UN03874